MSFTALIQGVSCNYFFIYVSDDFKTKKNSWEKKMFDIFSKNLVGIFDEMPLSAYLFRLESSIQ